MKKAKLITSSAVVMTMVMSSIVPAFAYSKEETVYSKLKTNGSEKTTVVSEHLINDQNETSLDDQSSLKNKEKDYHRLIKNEEKLKTIKHDMKHHLLYLLDCYENNNENFEKEIKKEIANLTKLETSVNTGVSSLDYIISSKREIFQEKNIQFIIITTMEISFLINWTRILYLEILLIMQLRIVQQIHQKKSLLI